MDPIIGQVIIALIQVAAEYATKAGMTKEQLNQHFLDAYEKAKLNIPAELPDAVLKEGDSD